MITVLVNGTLMDDPEAHTEKTGEPKWTAKLKSDDSWVRITASKKQGYQLSQLTAGSPVSVCGIAKIILIKSKSGDPLPIMEMKVTKLISAETLRIPRVLRKAA